MTGSRPYQPRPAKYKSVMDGLGGLVRIPIAGGPHEGRELYIDEPEIPGEIFATPRGESFEWWPARLREVMAATTVGGDPPTPPIRYVLHVDPESGEPRFVADEGAS